MNYNLLSIATLEDKGCYATIKDGRFDIIDSEDDEVILTGTRVGKSYLLDMKYVDPLQALRSSKESPANHASWDEWHRRLGHLGMQDVKKLSKIATGIDATMADKLQKNIPPHKLCEECTMGKMTKVHNRVPHRQDVSKRETIKGAKISSDIAGGGHIKVTKGGHRYCASFICEATDMVWTYMLKRKSELPTMVRHFLVWMANQGHPVRRFTSDNEAIYASKEVQDTLLDLGIQWEPSTPYTPNQNAIAERTFRTLFGRVRAILRDAGFGQSLWGEALNYIVYTKNKSPSSIDSTTTPHEAWTGTKTDVSLLRPFGCIAYVYDTNPSLKTLDNKAIKCKFLGYGKNNNQYRFWDLQRKCVISSAWVQWELDASVDNKEMGGDSEFDEDDSWQFFTVEKPANEDDQATQVTDVLPAEDTQLSDSDSEDEWATPDSPPPSPPPPDPDVRLIRTRVQEKPDYRQLHGFRGYKKKGFAARACKVTVDQTPAVPANIDEALSGPDKDNWMAALQEELNSLKEMGTLDAPAPLPKGRKALPGRWVLTLKLDSNGDVARYKARWVVKGFKQIEGLDFNETFSSTVKGAAVRMLIALCAKYDYEMEQSDVTSAFLESHLKEEVWVEQPHGFTNGNRNDACRLLRALYGLKQSPREWYTTIRKFMESLSYTRLVKDHSIFIHENGMILAIYVDDILMCAPNKQLISEFKTQLEKRFRMKHLGDVSWYLGMSIVRDRPNRTIYINQTAYAKQLIGQLDMEDCQPATSPMERGNDMTAAPENYTANKEEAEGYRSLVGALQWLVTMKRPDLAYSIGKCGRYSNNPTTEHFNAAKRIAKYLAGTTDVGLRYEPEDATGFNPGGKLIGWTASSWSDDKATSHATSGYVFQLWNGPISWSSKLQTLCTDSTAEAEYVAQSNAAKEALFLGQLLAELGYDGDDIMPVRLMGDNQSAIKLANNPVNHARTKHIRNKFHLVREMVNETGELSIGYVNTADMVADGMTKPIAPNDFPPCRYKLGLSPNVIG